MTWQNLHVRLNSFLGKSVGVICQNFHVRKCQSGGALGQLSKLDSDNDQTLQFMIRRTRTIGSEHISLGSPSPSISIAEIEQRHVDDLAFTDFRKKIGKAFSNYFNEHIKFNAVDQVCRQRFLNSVKII